MTVLLCLLGLPVHAERLALVVGNAQYDNAPALANPVNDATEVAAALKRLDFKVTLMTDAAGDSLWAAMDDFVDRAADAESVVFYYSGHAFQMSGVNYLVPVNAQLASRDGAKDEAWSLDAIIARLQSRNHQTLVFLDACRNDPLPAAVRGTGASSDGLARVQTGVGTFVAFATEPGGVTVDGVQGARNSPFTTALLAHMETAGKSISDVMIEVRNDVETATLRKQVPWDQSSLREQFYFVPPSTGGRQELSEADYELLAQLAPADRKQFLDLLAQSGFDQASLDLADAEISLAEANLVQVAAETSVLIGAEGEAPGLSLEDLESAGDSTLVAPAGDPAAPASLEDLAVLESAVTVGVPEPQDTEMASLDPGKDEAPIRLAALNWATRDLAGTGLGSSRMRLAGRLLNAQSEADRALLAEIDPRLLEDVTAEPALAAADLAKGIQGELKRVGCYQMVVDGDWGKGSKTALTSYYLAKKVVPETLDPTPALFGQLQAEEKVVCQVRIAKSAVKTGKRAKVAQKADATTVEKTSITSKKKTGRKQETAKTRITKGTIGITGSF